MRRQIAPSFTEAEEIQNLKTFINAKNKEFKLALTNIKSDIIDAYAEYELNKHNLSALSPKGYDGVEKKALKSCYLHNTPTINTIKTHIFETRTEYESYHCPYCLNPHPKQFDHYLSKGIFSEFSVLAKNLVLVCKDCNEEKSELCYGPERTFHPYYDNLPDEQYLFCNLNRNGVATFSLVQPRNFDTSEFSVVIKHFSKLNLLNRYSIQSSIKIVEYKSVWKEKLTRGVSIQDAIIQITNDLSDSINSFKKLHGVNYFHLALLQSLLGNVEEIINEL